MSTHTRQAVESQINQISTEIAELTAEKDALKIGRLRADLEQLEEQLSLKTTGAVASSGGLSASLVVKIKEENLSLEDAKNLKEKRIALDEAISSSKKLEERINYNQQHLAELHQQRTTIINAAAIGNMVAFQNQSSKAINAINDLKNAINQQQTIIEQAEEALSRDTGLTEKRAEILAEIAMGNESAIKELKAIDDKIKVQSGELQVKKEAANKSIYDARMTITGLSIKLKNAESTLAKLEARSESVLSEFLTAEAEQIGNEYLKAAVSLETSFRRLIAVNRIMCRAGLKPISTGAAEGLFIPAFSIQPLIARTGNNRGLKLMNTATGYYLKELESDVEAEIKRWNDAGCRLCSGKTA